MNRIENNISRLGEEIKMANISCWFDGTEGGKFWIMEEDGDEEWIPIPFKHGKELAEFLLSWVNVKGK